jgi:hypothetical protein
MLGCALSIEKYSNSLLEHVAIITLFLTTIKPQASHERNFR